MSRISFRSLLAALCLNFLLLGFAAQPAVASTAETYPVDLSGIIIAAVGLFMAVLAALARTGVRAFVSFLEARTSLAVDEQTRAYLDAALDNALAWGSRHIADYAASKAASIEVRNEVLADALTYISAHVPDAVDHFGLTEDDIERMLEARLLKRFDLISPTA